VSTNWIWILASGLGASALGGMAAFLIVLRLPPDYFARTEPEGRPPGNLGHVIGRVSKNVVGVLLILGGIVLMLPGVPGPGIVVVLLGLSLTDLPGKHRLILSVARKPRVLGALNRLRRRFHRPDFVLP
jgi:hypothetical protein